MPRPPNPEVRLRLISTGRRVVHELGFNGCAVQDIAEAASVPKGSFYNYFDSKEAFAGEILEAYWEAIVARHSAVLREGRARPVARIRKFFRLLSDDHREAGFALGCLIGNLSLELSATNEQARLTAQRLLDHWQALLADCLREGQAAGEVAPGDADQLAAILIEAYEGAVMRSKIERNGQACERFEKVVLTRLLG
ncbi:TetR/AcrR family transcriptional regulator [Burkholderia gladioli]|uniref:TetR/AcrR family transcriptional regulator n=1 Tax=Burkholderia gladioli TaxID=28095 RepID=UPI001C23755B|nr:TetR/AcrR family transcriptional regulator [Burkholderia gladioli]MBU9168837.1 TetR/AcrR family transcriptional regulator [Burkholderia gladioli]